MNSVWSTPSSTAAGSAGTLTDQVAKTGAQDWLTQFKSGLSNRDVFALPYGDLDLTSVLRSSKGRPLLRTADELGRKATQKALGAPLDTTIAWPAGETVGNPESDQDGEDAEMDADHPESTDDPGMMPG